MGEVTQEAVLPGAGGDKMRDRGVFESDVKNLGIGKCHSPTHGNYHQLVCLVPITEQCNQNQDVL